MAKKDDADGADDEGSKGGGGLGGKLKLVAMILPTVLLIVGAVYFFVLAPSSDSSASPTKTTAAAKASATDTADEEDPEPVSTEVPGKLVTVDPVTINLSSGHYLKVGLALQATADAGEEVTGSKAADALIAEFSGKTVDEIATQAGRDAAKKALTKVIRRLYEKKVYAIYWTTFVMN